MLFNDFGDVFARVFTGQHEAGQAAVCEEGHREGEDSHDDQRDHAADAGVDRQEQYARADRGAVKTQHPHRICFAPSASRFCCDDRAGLSVFHLYLLEEGKMLIF